MATTNLDLAAAMRNSPIKDYLDANPFVDVVDKNGQAAKVRRPLESKDLETIYIQQFSPLGNQPSNDVLRSGNNNTYSDFQIGRLNFFLYDFYLVVTIKESSGTGTIIPGIGQFLCSYIQIIFDGASVAQELYASCLWVDLGFYSDNQLQNIQTLINMSTNFSIGNAQFLASSSGNTLYLIPTGNFFRYNIPWLGNIKNPVTIRIWWNGSFENTGTGTMDVSSAYVFAKLISIDTTQIKYVTEFYNKYTIDMPIYTTVPNQIALTSYSAGNPYSPTTQSLSGEIYLLYIFFYTSIIGAGLRKPTYITDTSTVDLTDAGGTSWLGAGPLSAKDNRYEQTLGKFSASVLTNVPFIPILLDQNPSMVVMAGQSNGYRWFDKTQQVKFNLSATFPTANYSIWMFGKKRVHTHQLTDGTFRVQTP